MSFWLTALYLNFLQYGTTLFFYLSYVYVWNSALFLQSTPVLYFSLYVALTLSIWNTFGVNTAFVKTKCC